ncbi:MAG: HAD-IA family hydrolase [Candidatus Liptonbacteria bacterium]|nr:HAD-IA family hydrolase [Candidatus Liptonbacteria bacterium]
MYQALVIDFFGVICSEVAPHWLGRYFSPTRAEQIKATIVHAADVGDISQSTMFDQLANLAGISVPRAEAEWEAEVRIDVDMIDFVIAAAPLYKVGMLTNSPSPFVRGILRRHKLSGLFRAIVVSSEIRTAKPERRAYERILKELGTVASAAFMIDDNPVNVAAAAKIGMKGIVFHSVDDVKRAVPVKGLPRIGDYE